MTTYREHKIEDGYNTNTYITKEQKPKETETFPIKILFCVGFILISLSLLALWCIEIWATNGLYLPLLFLTGGVMMLGIMFIAHGIVDSIKYIYSKCKQ